jgi:hypothetical protein
MYEWPWIEREKDHRAVDIRVIRLMDGLQPSRSRCLESVAAQPVERQRAKNCRCTLQSDSAVPGERFEDTPLWHGLWSKHLVYRGLTQESSALTTERLTSPSQAILPALDTPAA